VRGKAGFAVLNVLKRTDYDSSEFFKPALLKNARKTEAGLRPLVTA
jgi:hypothetical protein